MDCINLFFLTYSEVNLAFFMVLKSVTFFTLSIFKSSAETLRTSGPLLMVTPVLPSSYQLTTYPAILHLSTCRPV